MRKFLRSAVSSLIILDNTILFIQMEMDAALLIHLKLQERQGHLQSLMDISHPYRDTFDLYNILYPYRRLT